MKRMRLHKALRVFLLVAVAGGTLLGMPRAQALAIGDDEILKIPSMVVGSGNGTLDLLLFTDSNGGAGNIVHPSPPGFNGDDANTSTPSGGGSTDTSSFAESYVTTAGDLQAFYDLNFGTGVVDEIVLFLDLNETTSGGGTNTLGLLDVILNPTSITGSPDPTGDVSSTAQNAIDQGYSGGSTIAYLDPQPAMNLPLNNQGAGFADYAIFTGIDPYSLNASDVLLFNTSMSVLSDGGETIFLSGEYGPHDLVPPTIIPEPATIGLLSLSLIGLAGHRRRRRVA